MKQGFTLIELLVVVVIIAVLSAIALPQYQTAVERSRATEALTLMNAISTSAQRYHAQHEAWPGTNMNRLDVDVPTRPCPTGTTAPCYGGKNFHITLQGPSSSQPWFQINAHRFKPNGSVASHPYTLQTRVSPQANGTYTTQRLCIPAENDQDATDNCNAISGGHPSDF